jgi:hypothetical protein
MFTDRFLARKNICWPEDCIERLATYCSVFLFSALPFRDQEFQIYNDGLKQHESNHVIASAIGGVSSTRLNSEHLTLARSGFIRMRWSDRIRRFSPGPCSIGASPQAHHKPPPKPISESNCVGGS